MGYADDVDLVESGVESMITKLTAITDVSEDLTDMKINMDNTISQHVFRRNVIKTSDTEAREIEQDNKFKCDFCSRRFKTNRGMYIHRNN